jgi:hypothetical protein
MAKSASNKSHKDEWKRSAAASRPAASFRMPFAKFRPSTPNSWYFGANRRLDERAPCGATAQLRLPSSLSQVLPPASRRRTQPAADPRPGADLGVAPIGQIPRVCSSCRLEWLVHSPARCGWGVQTAFSDDTLADFTRRLDPKGTRQALANTLKHAKRNKAFENTWRLGLAVDGAGYATRQPCPLCHPVKDKESHTRGRLHHFVTITVVGTGLTLPLDVEPYGPEDCECNAGARLVKRSVALLGPRFADYLVVDGEFATAPFPHAAGKLDLPVAARLVGRPPRYHLRGSRRPGRTLGRRRFRSLGNPGMEDRPGDALSPTQAGRNGGGRLPAHQFLPRRTPPAAAFIASPRAAGRSRTRASTTARTATAWSTSGAMNRTACRSAGCRSCRRWSSSGPTGCAACPRGDHGVRGAIHLVDTLWLNLRCPLQDNS